MINGLKVIVVLPAYNAAKTLKQTYSEIDTALVDEVILVDDASKDDTIRMAKEIGITRIIQHEKNKGYGGNQKTCYRSALDAGADIVVMLHPDYQYTPALIRPMVSLIADNVYPVVLGSRILGKGARRGGMPLYKYIFNRCLTLAQNLLMWQKLSEYHTGYRAYHKDVLQSIPWQQNSDDFVFDNEMLAQIFYAGYEVAEITCPTRYSDESSSINIRRSMIYGLGVLRVSFQYAFQKMGIARPSIFRGIVRNDKLKIKNEK
jgi:glycosyltransferase involved in cell wall biosynthesis